MDFSRIITELIEMMTQLTNPVSNENFAFVSYFQDENDSETSKETNSKQVDPIITHVDPNLTSNTTIARVETAITHPNPTTQLLLSSKMSIHMPEAGLNPLVDAAAYLFSIMGKLKHIKSNNHLDKLQEELKREIENFRDAIQAYSYNAQYISEYIPIACFALCVSLDDIISNTPWGAQGKWKEFNLVAAFFPDPPSHLSFFLILERLIMDPAVYIDVMEFMYICLSLGFKCGYNSHTSEFNNEQIEQVINSLYKRIRAFRGNFNKALSPFSIRPPQTTSSTLGWKSIPNWLVILIASSLSIILFTGGTYSFDYFFKQKNHIIDPS